MESISFYLENVSIKSDEKDICKYFKDAVESVIGCIDDEITYSNNVIKLNTSGVVKSEIFLNKKKILSDLNSKLDGMSISNIY